MSQDRYTHIATTIQGGGQIMHGTMKPTANAAVAHDGSKTLAMLRQRPQENVEALLVRLDQAIAHAQASGQRVDEINSASAPVRYEF